MPEERAELTGYHPTGNLSEPVLAFPCSIRELMSFLNMQAIGIEIDEKHMSPEQYEEVIACLGATQTTYRVSSRMHALDHIINMARGAVNEPNNYQSVWAEMVRIAELEFPPSPIKEYVEGEGIKYVVYTQDEDAVRFFTKNALRKKMVRQGR
ncbi:hypothetical protein [Paenalcaligenes suwonensis]|uniref:hypothetical protein n=1 Tax=Paenalcaligenes suwonensis TaxID=1202713 RepID=UPI0014098C24|nr:hypothetical protein [Paenalcaligenes suwonensis]NHC60108.1 hypothetical protein [Paenalcaligenes suwonensis]